MKSANFQVRHRWVTKRRKSCAAFRQGEAGLFFGGDAVAAVLYETIPAADKIADRNDLSFAAFRRLRGSTDNFSCSDNYFFPLFLTVGGIFRKISLESEPFSCLYRQKTKGQCAFHAQKNALLLQGHHFRLGHRSIFGRNDTGIMRIQLGYVGRAV